MLRIKRSVSAQYNTTVNFMSAQLLANQTNAAAAATNDMKKLEAEAESMREVKDVPLNADINIKKGVLFVHAETQGGDRDNNNVDGDDGKANVNPEEIQLDDSDDDDEEDGSSSGSSSEEEDGDGNGGKDDGKENNEEDQEDDQDDVEEEEDNEVHFERKKVPEEVFGGLKKTSKSSNK